MADGLRQLTGLEDPIGEVTGMKKRPNVLLIGQKRVPLGVIGIIYEARPNLPQMHSVSASKPEMS